MLDVLRVVLGGGILIYASYLDWKYRKIDDKSWLSLVVVGVIFLGYEVVEDITSGLNFLMSVGTTAFLTALLYFPGMLSGGDVKVLIGISALIPTPFHLTLFPFFSLSVFANAVLLSCILPFLFFVYNIRHLGGVRTAKDFLALFLGYKRKGSEVKDYEAIIGKGGEYKLLISTKKVELGEKAEGEVWVSPAIPFVVPITIGFFLSVLFGDILSFLMM
jgi:preflagellin peptidase FlaK